MLTMQVRHVITTKFKFFTFTTLALGGKCGSWSEYGSDYFANDVERLTLVACLVNPELLVAAGAPELSAMAAALALAGFAEFVRCRFVQ